MRPGYHRIRLSGDDKQIKAYMPSLKRRLEAGGRDRTGEQRDAFLQAMLSVRRGEGRLTVHIKESYGESVGAELIRVARELGLRVESPLVDASHDVAAQEPSPSWEDIVNRQDWDEATQIVHLEGFIRHCGLADSLAEYAQRVAREEQQAAPEALHAPDGRNRGPRP